MGKSTLLIAVTGFGQEEDRRRALEAGFDSHMVKPVNFAEPQKQAVAAPWRLNFSPAPVGWTPLARWSKSQLMRQHD
jgi:CheY-like chemotaxis protein